LDHIEVSVAEWGIPDGFDCQIRSNIWGLGLYLIAADCLRQCRLLPLVTFYWMLLEAEAPMLSIVLR
tara:strand:+ start:810 stop:1010 length:201 start_codon:yes stop_codon:yes gene_type:complete